MKALEWSPEFELEYWNSRPKEFYLGYVNRKYKLFDVDSVVHSHFENRDINIAIDVGGGKYGGALHFFKLSNKKIVIDALSSVFKKETDIDDIEFINADFSEIPLSDNSVDIIFAWEVLDHAKTKKHFKQGQKELSRILKRNGLLFFQNPMREKPTDNHPVIISTNEVLNNFSGLNTISHVELERMGKYQRIKDEKDLYLILTKNEY